MNDNDDGGDDNDYDASKDIFLSVNRNSTRT